MRAYTVMMYDVVIVCALCPKTFVSSNISINTNAMATGILGVSAVSYLVKKCTRIRIPVITQRNNTCAVFLMSI